MPQCTKCKKLKGIEEFHKDRTRKDGHKRRCKKCYNSYAKKYARTEKEKEAVYGRRLKRKYNITLVDYDIMFIKQNGVCAICEKPEKKLYNDVPFRLAVDHNHKTGKVRGLLCTRCNTRLVTVEDRDFMKKAKRYLRGY